MQPTSRWFLAESQRCSPITIISFTAYPLPISRRETLDHPQSVPVPALPPPPMATTVGLLSLDLPLLDVSCTFLMVSGLLWPLLSLSMFPGLSVSQGESAFHLISLPSDYQSCGPLCSVHLLINW